MKKLYLLLLVFWLTNCTKKVGKTEQIKADQQSVSVATECQYSSTSVISFSKTVLPLMINACGSCHSNPGSGGINLDDYGNIKALAQSDQLTTVITNTDPGSPTMPPPPNKHLDLCQIRAVTLWIKQGYQNN